MAFIIPFWGSKIWALINERKNYQADITDSSPFCHLISWRKSAKEYQWKEYGFLILDCSSLKPLRSDKDSYSIYILLHLFHTIDLFLYLLKTSENQRFSDVFRRYKKRPVAWNRLKKNENILWISHYIWKK